ncbi:sel1 repeat family protein [Dokdonella sp.]|uniref:sel1 repeat family protein n=1 Tax=Dokdonella sp. TaxID=2291710 RepID=UPI003528B6E1
MARVRQKAIPGTNDPCAIRLSRTQQHAKTSATGKDFFQDIDGYLLTTCREFSEAYDYSYREKWMKDMRRYSRILTFVFSMCSVAAFAQADTEIRRSPTYSDAAHYDSGRSTGDRMGFTGPEKSGRPGVAYFEKGAEALEKGQTAFAIEMYEVSASWAFKPAQYNLSVMYAKGDGVPVDMPRAMAWAALAAERGEKKFVRARDAINVELSSEQVAMANAILEELKPKYADKKALRKAKRRWRDSMQSGTGSRLRPMGNVKVGAGGSALASSSPGLTMFNAWELTGGKQNDGSREYRQILESDNPYDPKDRVRTGTATVGEIQPIPDLSARQPDSEMSAKGSSQQ